MTCIVGLETKDELILASDRRATIGDRYSIMPSPKVHKKGLFLVGCAGTLRFLQIIEHWWEPPEQHEEKSDYEFICTDIIESLSDIVNEKNYTKDHEDNLWEGSIVLGYKNNFYDVRADGAVIQAGGGVVCVGSGEDYAEAALTVLREHSNCSDEKCVEIAVKTASRFSWSCDDNVDILKMKKRKKRNGKKETEV